MSRREIHTALLKVHEETVLRGPGASSVEQRAAAASGEGQGVLSDYARLMHAAAYKVTPEQLSELQKTHSDDVLFEVTVSAAFGEAKRRHEAALSALDAAWSEV